jgi:ribosomal-protein-alanine N-acetyltransferase
MIKLTRKRHWQISLAVSTNYTKLANIHSDCFDHGWSEDELVSTMAVVGTRCHVANLAGNGIENPDGFLVSRTIGEQSEILTLAVDPKCRNQGIATALMNHAIRQLQADRVSKFFLEVSEANLAALKLYRSLNFRQISVRKGYYSNRSHSLDTGSADKSNALVMQLELG